MSDTPKVVVTRTFNALWVHINGLPHIYIVRDKLLGMQSWKMEASAMFLIEFAMTDRDMRCEYDNRELWATILTGLGENL